MIEGIIYLVEFEDNTNYVGSTQYSINKRLLQHRNNKPNKNGFSPQITSKLNNNIDFIIKILKNDLFFNKYDLWYWERIYTKLTDNTINKNQCWRTTEEEKLQIKNTKTLADKKYREKNRITLNNYKNIKYTCACGGSYNNGNKPRHFRTKKHIEYLNKL